MDLKFIIAKPSLAEDLINIVYWVWINLVEIFDFFLMLAPPRGALFSYSIHFHLNFLHDTVCVYYTE